MINNNTQVNPRNGVDFLTIRKAKSGIKINKFANGGITILGGTWYDTIFSQFKQDILNEIASAQTAEQKQALIKKYNDLQAIYGKLRSGVTDLTKVNFSLNVKDYLELINTLFPFVNTKGISHGRRSKRYKEIGTADRYGSDNADTAWKSDGYWAAQTQDRTTLGYAGDWDQTSEAFKKWLDELKNFGLETFLDETDNTYKLRLLNNGVGSSGTSSNITLTNGNSGTVGSRDGSSITESGEDKYYYIPKEYPADTTAKYSKFRMPTFPLYNAALFGVGDITNKRLLDTALKTNGFLEEATPAYARTTDAYPLRSLNKLKLLEYKYDILQLLDNTSDLGRALEAYRDIRAKELDTDMQNAAAKNLEYNQTLQNVNAVANANLAAWNLTRNRNISRANAEERWRLNNIAAYLGKLGELAQLNIMSNYTDWKAWNRSNMVNDFGRWLAGEYEKVKLALARAKQDYYNTDIKSFSGYNDFWSNALIKGADDVWRFNESNKFFTDYGTWLLNKGLSDSDENRYTFFLENAGKDEYKDIIGPLETAYTKWVNDKLNEYISITDLIMLLYNSLIASNKPVYFSGEVSPELYFAQHPLGTFVSPYDTLDSQRGTASYAKGGKFLEYLKHNRKAEKDIRDVTTKTMKNSMEMLRRDLNSLDRESLLLLREIFK